MFIPFTKSHQLFYLFAVKFRYVVFRPFIDEVLVGKIKSSSSDGVQGM